MIIVLLRFIIIKRIWLVMVLNANFNNISVISWGWWRKPEYPEKTTDLSHITALTTSVVVGTDCTGSGKSNYHAITTTTASKRTRQKI